MYTVTVKHHEKAWRNGDLEDVLILVETRNFKTRKDAKAWMLRDGQTRGNTISCTWKKGNYPSYLVVFTGRKWIHENTGETMEEYYQYVMDKTKVG